MTMREQLLQLIADGPKTLDQVYRIAHDSWGLRGSLAEATILTALLDLVRDGALQKNGQYPKIEYRLSDLLQLDLAEGLPLRDPQVLWQRAEAVGITERCLKEPLSPDWISRLEASEQLFRERAWIEFDLLVSSRLEQPGRGQRLLAHYSRLPRLFLEAVCRAVEARRPEQGLVLVAAD
jgi:hypothetical protein